MTAEHDRAKHWRKEIMGLSRPALAELLGYSVRTILQMESGQASEAAMHRYRLACAAITIGVDFDWTSATLKMPVKGQLAIKAR